MSKVKEVIELGIKLRHLLEQDSTINSEAWCSFLTKALVGYDDQYYAHVNNLQQRQITDILRQRTDTQPQPGPSTQPQARPSTTSTSDDEETEFEGFGLFETEEEA